MSFIGSLDKFDLSIVLQRIEAYRKTGLLTVKQGERSVELSFRQGQLMCVGPVRPNVSLGERLLQAGVISREACQAVAFSLGADQYREIGSALAFIDMGYVNQESLYRWAMSETSRIIGALLTWTSGELYFEENQQPPANRLLIALSVTSLLPAQTSDDTPRPVKVGTVAAHQQQPSRTRPSYVSEMPTLHGEESTFFDNTTSISSISASIFSNATLQTERNTDALARPTTGSLFIPQPVTAPIPPIRVNTAYMQPYMVLTPADLSGYRLENPQIQLTPQQWRLFTCADGQITLQMAAQELGMAPEQVCQVAGELIALRLVTISMPTFEAINEPPPASREYTSVGGVAPDLTVPAMQPWESVTPAAYTAAGQYTSPAPIETDSQWGNGGNGATFVFGYGWVVASSPSNSSQPSQPLSISSGHKAYAKAG